MAAAVDITTVLTLKRKEKNIAQLKMTRSIFCTLGIFLSDSGGERPKSPPKAAPAKKEAVHAFVRMKLAQSE